MATQIANTLQKKKTGIASYLTNEAVKTQISNIIGGQNATKFVSSVVSAVNANPALQECDNASIISGALLGESLKLTPSPQLGQYYLVPFNDKDRGKVAQFQLGYKGLLQLAIRSGQYKKINVVPVKEGELVKYDPFEDEIVVNLIEDEDLRENTSTIGYFAMFEYVNGFRKTLYWSRKKMEAHALKYSKGYSAKKGYTFWEKDFDSMAIKTMLKQLLGRYGILSIEMQEAFDSDMAVINADGSKQYVESSEFEVAVEAPAETKAEDEIKKALMGESHE